jgi:hypothetical protein
MCFLCEETEDPAFCSVEQLLQEMHELVHHYGALYPSTMFTPTMISLRRQRVYGT